MHIYKVFTVALIFIIVALAVKPASGQILHIDREGENADTLKAWSANLDLSFELNNQDADAESDFNYLGLTSQLNVGHFTTNTSYLWLNHLNYMTTPEEAFISTGYTHFRINFLRQRNLSYETFTQFQYDASRGLKQRWLAGAGIRYKLYKTDKSSVYTGVGLMHESESWKTEGPEATKEYNEVNMLKSTNYLTADLKFNERAAFTTTAYYQTGYHQEKKVWRHRISLDANLIFKITKRISFKTALSSTFENKPIIPIKRFIYTLTHGIRVEI